MKKRATLSQQRTIVEREIERFVGIAAEVSQGEPDYTQYRARLVALMSLLIASLHDLDQKIKKME